MILKIVQTGDPVLRQGTTEVEPGRIGSPELQRLIELMRATMLDAPGVGLAAPQVGVPLRLAVLEDRAEVIAALDPADVRAKDRRPVPFQVLINPRLRVLNATPATFVEGCLSVAGFAAEVPRAHTVEVKALDHRGQPLSIVASGWHARILQHEIDHLEGTLYLDRMNSRTFTNVLAHPGRRS